MNKYKFLDVGCKIGGSFSVAKKFGYDTKQGIGIDINEQNVKKFTELGYNAIVADATNIPFNDNSFDLVIFSHVIEHLPNEQMGRKALEECLRVSNKYVFLALPFFDENDYLNSLGLKTYYSDWSGHKNMVHLKTIQNEYLVGYNFEITMKTKLSDSLAIEIHPINSPRDSHGYDEKLHGKKEYVKFDKNIWREYTILITKK